MEKVEVKNQRNLKPTLIGVGVALGILVVGCTIFLSVYMTQLNKKLEWVGFQGGFPGRQGSMHEESEIDPERRTILHMNPEGWRIGINNSISLHDYKQGLLATKLMETGTCMIIDLVDTYEEASEALATFKRTGVAKERPAREFDSGKLISEDQLDEEIGDRLADFCRGSPTYRLHEVPVGTVSPRHRRVAMEEADAVCIQNTFVIVIVIIREAE